jgi:hypothetical protein
LIFKSIRRSVPAPRIVSALEYISPFGIKINFPSSFSQVRGSHAEYSTCPDAADENIIADLDGCCHKINTPTTDCSKYLGRKTDDERRETESRYQIAELKCRNDTVSAAKMPTTKIKTTIIG